jgi:RimJ/RimL family protein N-acetyltransferase
MMRLNDFGQPIGPDLGAWLGAQTPTNEPLVGVHVTLEPLDADRHCAAIHEATKDNPASIWTYMPTGPFETAADLQANFEMLLTDPTNSPYAVVIDGTPAGHLEYLRIDAKGGAIEIGWVLFSTKMQRTIASTETQYLLMRNAFELGYRRLEWKCDDMNAPSRVAAERLGYTYEGTFRKATHYKGQSRDTAWYAITDDEWPAIDAAFQAWLALENHDENGQQRKSLTELRQSLTNVRPQGAGTLSWLRPRT